MTPEETAQKEVEAVLSKAANGSRATDGDLFPVYHFILPDSGSSSSHSSNLDSRHHWYCSKVQSPLHVEASTYLIYLFAFKRDGMPKRWLESLEVILKGCDQCARAFGGARRKFGVKYLGGFPAETRRNFFKAVDKWQEELILRELERSGQNAYGETSYSANLLDLATPIVQLLFSEPSIAESPLIAKRLDDAMKEGSSRAYPAVTSLGLTPLIVKWLHSADEIRRNWAVSQLSAHARRPLSYEEWCSTGVGSEIENLYMTSESPSSDAVWKVMESLIKSNALSKETLEKGLLGGDTGEGRQRSSSRGFAAALAHQLGSKRNHYHTLLNCFRLLLQQVPNSHFWNFDPSPQLPPALFSEIKDNPAFRQLLISEHVPANQDLPNETWSKPSDAKGKRRENRGGNESIEWITDYLISLMDANSSKGSQESAFPETLARVMQFLLSEMQHEQFIQELRAALAQQAFEILMVLQSRTKDSNLVFRSSIDSIFEVHADFITKVALRFTEEVEPNWQMARSSACDLLAEVFAADGRDVVGSVLGLAQVALVERKRMRKVKSGRSAPPPLVVDKLRLVDVRKELWHIAYGAVSAKGDFLGAKIFINSIATFAHIEKLDRRSGWTEKGLAEVIKEEDWVNGVRAINTALEFTRDKFPRLLESVARSPHPATFDRLWAQAGLAKSAVMLLLSPAEDVHSAALDFISQSFPEASDRADCFRVILLKFPAQAMDGLVTFLGDFIEMASRTPDSCSLAKWLVRCFTDILECMCTPSEDAEAILQIEKFISVYAGGRSMADRLNDLWQLMTDSLTIIFDRTKEWAPLYDNEIMVDWMRDALIFGRLLIDNIRVFEAAMLGNGFTNAADSHNDEGSRVTSVGKSLIKRFELVLKQLVSWLRLTDVETLHQTFELLRTILQRIAKSPPDLGESPELEATLHDIDKFARKAGKNYRTRLSDDLLVELSDLILPFDLDLGDDEVRFISQSESNATRTAATTSNTSKVTSQPHPSSSAPKRNAFEEMMKSAGKAKVNVVTSSVAKSATKPEVGSSKQAPIDVDDFDDDFLDSFSANDLDIIEKRAKIATNSTLPKVVKPPTRPIVRPTPSGPAAKLNINVVARPPTKPSGSSFKSKFMQEMRREHRHQAVVAKQVTGGIVRNLPPPSGLGSGLGAFTGARRKIEKVESSGSSASDSSDEENKGVKTLISKQKSPLKRVKAVEARQIKVLGPSLEDVYRQREDRRANQHAMKQRLRPDLTPLYRYILGWNPAHTGPDAPHHHKQAIGLTGMGHVPTTFPSAAKYEQVMLPLFLQELWQQCLKDSNGSRPAEIEIASKSYEDDFLDIEAVVQGALPPDFMLNESDIVLLKQTAAPRPIFAKVQVFKRKFKDTGVKLRILAIMDINELRSKTKWLMHKHLSLSTAIREFGALKGLPYYDPMLLQDVLAGRAATTPRLLPSLVEDAKKAYAVNEPQARAILGAMNSEGFALIQGPPGTGKTKTISGLVGKFLSERSTKIPMNGEKASKSKLLVCAPSNAAIDEVCKRLMNGVPSSTGSRINPTIVRIGIESSVNIAVKDVSLDALVEAYVNSSPSNNGGGNDYARIQSELNDVKEKIREKQDQLKLTQGNDERYKILENEYHALTARRTQLGQQSSKAKDAARDATRHLEGARRAAKDSILADADIICATLSGAGQDILAPYIFETVIIDEAAQAIEMSCLIPLKYGCRRCIMVGDPNQLPPTTFSIDAEKFHYNESLFVRIVRRDPSHVHLLSIQYRMHPFISELPSKVFYDGRLTDGPNMASKTAAIWHRKTVFGPYRFFNVVGVEQKAGTSTKNAQEAVVAVELYRCLEADFGEEINLAMRIGVITMYKEQLWELKRKFTETFGRNILDLIEFNTVDGFQGQEKDIIILSCVRSGDLRTIGFLKDPRRMNVALTRAKSSLFVIGNGPTLEGSDARWKTIVADARDRGFFVEYTPSIFTADVKPLKAKVNKERSVATPIKSFSSASTALPPKQLASSSALKRKPSQDSLGESGKEKLSKSLDNQEQPRPENRPTAHVPQKPSAPVLKQTLPSIPDSVATPKNGQAALGPQRPSTAPAKGGMVRPNGPLGPPPPRPPPRSAEDVLFIRKKKKNMSIPGRS